LNAGIKTGTIRCAKRGIRDSVLMPTRPVDRRTHWCRSGRALRSALGDAALPRCFFFYLSLRDFAMEMIWNSAVSTVLAWHSA
jgi:hypothetical protein